MNQQAIDKSLRIKVGVLKRAVKELKMYKKEVIDNEAKLRALGEGHDRYRQTKQALEESRNMVPDTKSRMTAARDDMDDFLDEHELRPKEGEKAEGMVEQALFWIEDSLSSC